MEGVLCVIFLGLLWLAWDYLVHWIVRAHPGGIVHQLPYTLIPSQIYISSQVTLGLMCELDQFRMDLEETSREADVAV